MYEPSVQRILDQLPPSAIVFDLGGWARRSTVQASSSTPSRTERGDTTVRREAHRVGRKRGLASRSGSDGTSASTRHFRLPIRRSSPSHAPIYLTKFVIHYRCALR